MKGKITRHGGAARRARASKTPYICKDDDFVDVNAGRHEIQALNRKLNAAKWELHLRGRGLHPYCNAPCPED